MYPIDDSGNNLVEETDARGHKTTYTVDGDLESIGIEGKSEALRIFMRATGLEPAQPCDHKNLMVTSPQ